MKFAGCPVNPFLLPVYFIQGKWTRLVTPRLPDAAGPQTGSCAGAEPALRLIVIGDSTVAGIGAATHAQALTGQVAQHLSAITQRRVNWRALGQTSATSEIMRAQLLPRLVHETADVIVLSFGVNDVTRVHTPSRWRANLAGMTEALRAQFGALPLIHAGVPPLGHFPALPRPLRGWLGVRAQTFDDIAREFFTQLPHGQYSALPRAATANGFAADGYHPNELTYRLWGEQVAACCRNALLPSA